MSVTSLSDKLPAAGRLVEYCGAQTPAVFSSPKEELAALRTGCGVFDLSWRAKWVVWGGLRTRWVIVLF